MGNHIFVDVDQESADEKKQLLISISRSMSATTSTSSLCSDDHHYHIDVPIISSHLQMDSMIFAADNTNTLHANDDHIYNLSHSNYPNYNNNPFLIPSSPYTPKQIGK